MKVLPLRGPVVETNARYRLESIGCLERWREPLEGLTAGRANTDYTLDSDLPSSSRNRIRYAAAMEVACLMLRGGPRLPAVFIACRDAPRTAAPAGHPAPGS